MPWPYTRMIWIHLRTKTEAFSLVTCAEVPGGGLGQREKLQGGQLAPFEGAGSPSYRWAEKEGAGGHQRGPLIPQTLRWVREHCGKWKDRIGRLQSLPSVGGEGKASLGQINNPDNFNLKPLPSYTTSSFLKCLLCGNYSLKNRQAWTCGSLPPHRENGGETASDIKRTLSPIVVINAELTRCLPFIIVTLFCG